MCKTLPLPMSTQKLQGTTVFCTMRLLRGVCVLLLSAFCATQSREIQQLERLKKAKLGETVEMKCLTKSYSKSRVWYKLIINRSLLLLASTNVMSEGNSIKDDHYLLNSSEDKTTLTIKQMRKEDVGTYYCGIFSSVGVLFGSGTVLELDQDHVYVGTKVLSELEPYTLIVAVVVLGLVVCVLLWGIWRSGLKREVKRCDHRSLSNQPDDGLTYTAGELLSSSGSTTARLRRDRDAYTKVWYCHCE